MPELPDLEVILQKLRPNIVGSKIVEATLKEPLVLRMMVQGQFAEVCEGQEIRGIERHGPFLVFKLQNYECVVHCMLTGTFSLAAHDAKAISFLAFSLKLSNGVILHFGDRKKMAKVYIISPNAFDGIPGYSTQGVDVLGSEFTLETFLSLIGGRRNQVRVFIMDQSLISAIGNAYADEILFHAGIHPKTPCSILSETERAKLYESIKRVISWGTEEVERANQPIEKKVRGHMQVRNRKGESCYVCGNTIRRAQVHGYDTFFCPSCQPPKGKQFIPWDQKYPLDG